MKLNQQNNEQSNNIMQKINNDINRTMIQQKRLYSSFSKRPLTSTKLRKTWNYGKYSLDTQNLGYSFQNSYYLTKNLYLNKKSFAWGKNKLNKPNKYYESERLFERVMQLQNKINILNDQNTEQKIEINKQKKELIKQNKLLNEVNKKIFFDNLLNNNESEVDTIEWGRENSFKENDNIHLHTPLSKRRCYSSQQMNGINNNKKQSINLDNISNDNLKDMYKKILKQNQIKEKEILRLKQKIDSMNFSNETLISNMKHQYKQLQNENNKNAKEFQELKKSTKCTKYNELIKEKEIYEKEMNNIKDKFYKMSEVLEKYKNCYEENKILKEELNKKNVKINNLQNEIVLFSQNSEDIINNLKKEINKKNRKIQKLENEMKKYICGDHSPKDNKKMSKNNSFNKLIFNSRNSNNNIYNIKNNKNDINSNNLYFNHCLNFNKNNNNNQFLSPSSLSGRANLFSASWKNIRIKNQKSSKEKGHERVIPTRNSRVKEIILSCPELYQLYIEMKKRNINDSKTFINEVLLKLKDDSSITDNKNTYYKSIIKLFKIEDESGKKIIENLSNKEFGENKQLKDVKMHNLKILNELFSLNQEKNNKDILEEKLKEINKDKFMNSIKKYDEYESGYIYFSQMISIIKEFKFEQYIEDILLLTKESDVFNLMNYNTILNIINQKDKKEKKEKKDNVEIKDKNDDKSHSKEINDNKNDVDKDKDIDKDNNKSNGNNKNNNIIKNMDKKDDLTLNKEKNDFNGNNDKNDNKEDNNNINNTSDIENEFKDKDQDKKEENNDNQDIINEKVEKILKNLAHIILIEGSTPYNYISSLKETNNLKDNNSINVINPRKLFKFLEEKKLSVSEDEKNGIIREYGIKIDDNNLFIDHDKLVEKLFENLKNDEGNSNDEDFMKNIKNYDIEGMD